MIVPSSPPLHVQVQGALEAVYREFAAPAPSRIEGCPCCISARRVDVLLTTPLRDLTGDALWRYVSGAFLTVGSERDFRYLLPRILDISVNEPDSFINTEIVLGKLKLANWTTWSGSERQAIEALLDLWFEQALARDLAELDEYRVRFEAESVLCGIARAGLPLKPYLERLQKPDANRILDNLKAQFPGELSPFWENAPAGLEELSKILIKKSDCH